MTKQELRSLIREEIQKAIQSEVYYSPSWSISNIKKWLETYAKDKNIPLKALGKKKLGGMSDVTLYMYKLGDRDIALKHVKVPGAPRLNDIDVYVGKLEGSTMNYKDGRGGSMNSVGGDEDGFIKLLDKSQKI